MNQSPVAPGMHVLDCPLVFLLARLSRVLSVADFLPFPSSCNLAMLLLLRCEHP